MGIVMQKDQVLDGIERHLSAMDIYRNPEPTWMLVDLEMYQWAKAELRRVRARRLAKGKREKFWRRK